MRLTLLARLRGDGIDARLWMPGAREAGREDYIAELEARGGRAAASPMRSRSPPPTDAIADAYAASDLVLQLSRKPESFGRTVIEALVGRPSGAGLGARRRRRTARRAAAARRGAHRSTRCTASQQRDALLAHPPPPAATMPDTLARDAGGHACRLRRARSMNPTPAADTVAGAARARTAGAGRRRGSWPSSRCGRRRAMPRACWCWARWRRSSRCCCRVSAAARAAQRTGVGADQRAVLRLLDAGTGVGARCDRSRPRVARSRGRPALPAVPVAGRGRRSPTTRGRRITFGGLAVIVGDVDAGCAGCRPSSAPARCSAGIDAHQAGDQRPRHVHAAGSRRRSIASAASSGRATSSSAWCWPACRRSRCIAGGRRFGSARLDRSPRPRSAWSCCWPARARRGSPTRWCWCCRAGACWAGRSCWRCSRSARSRWSC